MALFKTRGVEIAGVTCAVPDNFIPASHFAERFGQDAVDRFVEGTGIHSIYNALPEQTAGDLACAAAEELFRRIPVEREKIGVMVLVTQSPDYRRPSTACVLQKRLRLPLDCACVEVALGCSGFVYGFQSAGSLLMNSDSEYALLLIGETASKLVNPMDKSIAMMYGDAGAAILLQKSGDRETTTILKSDGYRYKAIVLPAGGFRDMNPSHERFLCSDGNERTLYDIFMDGTSVFSFTISDVPQTIKAYYEATGTTAEDYDTILLHQANYYILKQVAKRIRATMEKIPVSLDRFGNTGAISIPLTLCDAYPEKSPGRTIRALMSGFGIGLSWGVTSAYIDTSKVFPIIKTSDFYAEGKFVPGDY